MADENILFGAEYDGSGLTNGVNQTLTSLESLKVKQTELKNSAKELNATLKVNEETTKQISKELSSLDKNSYNYKETVNRLNTALKQQINDEASLRTALQQKNVAIVQTTTELRALSRETALAERNNNALGNAVTRLTSVNALAARGVNRFSREIVSLGFGALGGLASIILAEAIPALVEFSKEILKTEEPLLKLINLNKTYKDVAAAGAKESGADIIKIEAYKNKLNDLTIPEADRVRIAREYNKVADETNQIDLTQINNLQLINEKIEAQNTLIIQRALTTAALSKLTDAASKLIEQELALQEQLNAKGYKSLDDYNKRKAKSDDDLFKNRVAKLKAGTATDLALTQEQVRQNRAYEAGFNKLVSSVNKGKADLQALASSLSNIITIPGLTTELKTPKGKKAPENVFAEQLAALRERLAKVTDSVFKSDTLIEKQFEEEVNKEFTGIDKFLRDKKLTTQQADILKSFITQINSLELSKSLDEFHKKQKEALEKINDELLSAQVDAQTKNISTIRDELERDRLLIDESYTRTVEGLSKRQRELFERIDEDVKKGLITVDQGKRKEEALAFVFGDLLTTAGKAKTNAELDLAFKTFQKTMEEARKPFTEFATQLSEQTSKAISKNSNDFIRGSIGFEKYQRRLTEILFKEASNRRQIEITEAQEQLKAVNGRLGVTTDPKQKDELIKQQTDLRNKLAGLTEAQSQADAQHNEDETKRKVEQIIKYAQAIESVTDSVLQFWSKVNDVEAAQLDRSIALQQLRVDRARYIAERGNAEYLELEQKRLDALELKREESARKQLAINNALTLSQATVAAVTAIGQAVETGSPFAAIAAVAAVIGAIASAYSFVHSLEPVTANFYRGTEEVDGQGSSRGKDTVKANLNIGERVVPTDTNYKYWDSLHAIQNHNIAPEVLNSFVNQYPNVNIPSLDFSRLSGATDSKIHSDSREVSGKLDEVNKNLQSVHKSLSELGISVNMDENGFYAAISKAARTKYLKSRS